jgi:protease I
MKMFNYGGYFEKYLFYSLVIENGLMKSLTGQKVAILVSGGFLEQDMLAINSQLTSEGAITRIVSPENGLVSSWNGSRWGHHFAVNCNLNKALGADYDILVVPGGRRSIDKLNLSAHTKRFINSFMIACKPIIVMGDALRILFACDQIIGYTVSGPENLRNEAINYGANWSENVINIDRRLMTGLSDKGTGMDFAEEMLDFLLSQDIEFEAA